MLKAAILGCVSALLAGCATIDYARLEPGSFKGSVIVLWLGEGNGTGDGNFLFLPDKDDPLVFRRKNARSPGAVVQPAIMYTDGGSIPKIAQAFNGLSPWGYAPAYMIHDWLFVARHCLVDGDPDPRYRFARDITFDESAAILGEAIRGLVEQRKVQENDVAAGAITSAVDSAIARRIWDEKGSCERSKVSAEDLAAAERAVPGSSRMAARSRSLALPTESLPRRNSRVVARVSF